MTDNDDVPEIGLSQLDAVLKFLPIFEQPGYRFGEVRSPEGQLPYYAFSKEMQDFIQALYDQGFVIQFDFNWPDWQDEAARYVADSNALERADALTLRKLLTVHVRKDRFADGHLAAMLENGHIRAILERLKEIREEMA